MANTKSAQKHMRQDIKRRVRNRVVRSSARTYVKRARVLINAGEMDESVAAVHEAISALDRAVAKGVIHRNNAARRKSRLMKRLHVAQQEDLEA